MAPKRKSAPGGNREGAGKSLHPQSIKLARFPQVPLLWAALQRSRVIFEEAPDPVTRCMAQTVAATWREAFLQEYYR
jgi:hypothetical protein